MKKKEFDLLTLGEILLRLSPPDNERIAPDEFPEEILDIIEDHKNTGYHIEMKR